MNGDELAGVVDQFGALTRAELRRAAEEVAFRAGDDVDDEAVDDRIREAEATLRLVVLDGGLLVPGPSALPTLPPGADNLPHVLDAPERSVDRSRAAEAAERRLREAAARAVTGDDRERAATLLDATYDLEAWAPAADASDVRARLDDAFAD